MKGMVKTPFPAPPLPCRSGKPSLAQSLSSFPVVWRERGLIFSLVVSGVFLLPDFRWCSSPQSVFSGFFPCVSPGANAFLRFGGSGNLRSISSKHFPSPRLFLLTILFFFLNNTFGVGLWRPCGPLVPLPIYTLPRNPPFKYFIPGPWHIGCIPGPPPPVFLGGKL